MPSKIVDFRAMINIEPSAGVLSARRDIDVCPRRQANPDPQSLTNVTLRTPRSANEVITPGPRVATLGLRGDMPGWLRPSDPRLETVHAANQGR